MIYLYRCVDCRLEHEVKHGLNDQPEIVCPECGGTRHYRLISDTAFHLKGMGWAKDRYAMTTRESDAKAIAADRRNEEATKKLVDNQKTTGKTGGLIKI